LLPQSPYGNGKLAGGVASVIAGLLVSEGPGGDLKGFNILGYVVVISALLAIFLIFKIDKSVRSRLAS